MSELPALYIQGVEVTQGVQHYRSKMHLYDAHDQAPDNSLRLVAYKAARVRVYVRSGEPQSINNVTGTLTVERFQPEAASFKLSPQPPGSLTAVPEPLPESAPFLSAQSLYRWERGSLQRTLNFVQGHHVLLPAEPVDLPLRPQTAAQSPAAQSANSVL